MTIRINFPLITPFQIAVCNLASVAVNMFVKPNRTYDFQKLREVVHVVTKNLNKIIEENFYPVPETRRSNMRHRPIGVGVQGLADAFILMRYPFDSADAKKLNTQIFETIYYAALEASVDLSAELGPYETYEGSPISKGVSQLFVFVQSEFDLTSYPFRFCSMTCGT